MDLSCPYQDKESPGSSHDLIFQWLKKLPAESRVLDVGAASGTTGKLAIGLPLQIYGIEPVQEWADQASPFYKSMFVTSIESAQAEILKGYQAVVLADVLEHTPEPKKNLERIVKSQTPGTNFLISVPNVANIWVRLNLLLGRFEYVDRGILDRTHLRFFTRKSFLEMLQESGLQISKLEVTPIPLELIHPFFLNSRPGRYICNILRAVTRIFPTLFAYQFVAQGEKRRENYREHSFS
ncbi:MAG: class I SAM-dependent methyltransferase [Dehalobacter sp.]|nr:class I SAM-dependent methyltransferase [Dehalobacter sp.]